MTARSVAAAIIIAWHGRPRFIDSHGATITVFAIQLFDRQGCVLRIKHFNKAEAFAATSFAVHDDFCGSYFTILIERIHQRLISYGISEITNIQLVAHKGLQKT